MVSPVPTHSSFHTEGIDIVIDDVALNLLL